MELKEFVTEVLTQIAEGVNAAKPVYEKLKGKINPRDCVTLNESVGSGSMGYGAGVVAIIMVDFKILVTKEASSKSKAGLSVVFPGIALGGGGGESKLSSDVNSISFSVPVVLP